MTYDELFPGAPVGTETFSTMIVKRADEKPCLVCRCLSQWEDCLAIARTCSPDCTHTMRNSSITHQSPLADGGGLTPCCHLTPMELPRWDRITEDPASVTCNGKDRSLVPV